MIVVESIIKKIVLEKKPFAVYSTRINSLALILKNSLFSDMSSVTSAILCDSARNKKKLCYFKIAL
jgi:hypothetical protein